MAKALTMPTAPEAPIAPQISIGERIHGIENRIEEIESISGMGKSRNNAGNTRQPAQQSQREQSEEPQESQESQESQEEQPQAQPQSNQQARPRQTQTPPQNQQRQNSPTPESMAREAVANGSGALTKRSTTRKNNDNGNAANDSAAPSRNQSHVAMPANSLAIPNDNGQTRFERGRAVLDEFKQIDQEGGKTNSESRTPSSDSSFHIPNSPLNNGHGAVYWLFTVVAVVIMAFVFIRQFLVNKDSKTPPLTKSTLDIPDIDAPLTSTIPKESAVNQYKQSAVQTKSKIPTPKPKPKPIVKTITKTKPLKLDSKNTIKTEDDNKGTRFEVRV